MDELGHVIEYLEKKASEFEIFHQKSRKFVAGIEKDQIKDMSYSWDDGYGVRVIINRGTGFSSCTTQESLMNSAKYAVKLAKLDDSEEAEGLPPSERYPAVTGTFDPAIQSMEVNDYVDLALSMIHGALDYSRGGGVEVLSGEVAGEINEVHIINSNGVEGIEKSTALGGLVEVKADSSTAYEFDVSRNSHLNFEDIGRRAARLALDSRNGIDVEDGVWDVILTPAAFDSILANTLYPSLSGESVYKGRSMLIRWLNEEVFPGLTIVDDGTLPEKLFTSSFDDEGSPSMKTALVDQGVLVGFLYDHKYGKKSGNESTGNAFRENYGSQPHIKPTNIHLEFNDITSDLMYDSAVVIHSFIGAHTANAISGDFSLEGRNAFLVENGDMKPLKSVMLYGNVYEMLKNVACFGKDERQVEHTISPSVRIRGMHLSG